MNQSLKYYLAGYNLAAFGFWLGYLCCFLAAGFKITDTGLLLLNIAQGMALLEIFHALLKWVKSPVGSTAAQVSSRIMVLVLINIFLRQSSLSAIAQIGIVAVSLAWGITELVRYLFYFLSLFNNPPKWLLWMRYSFFIVLYPAGVSGEWLLILNPLVAGHFHFVYAIFVVILAGAYLYYFPVLYRYMWKQRSARI
jgi:very-long-chain (3R)-3-hydroxyacyl-CoA dehydratase